MENDKRILIKADIRYKVTQVALLALIIYLVVIAVIFIAGFRIQRWSYVGSHCTFIERYEKDYRNSNLAGKIKEAWIYWGGFLLVAYSRQFYDVPSFHWYNIIPIFSVLIVLICIPFLIHYLYKRQCKVSSLTVTESGLYGSYMSKFKQVSLEMPIEKIDNVMILSGFWDKIRSGKTLSINSASGTIRMHFVQNADEVVAAAMKCIEEHKQSEKQTAAVVQSAPAASIMDKMKELTAMKDAGLITEEELAAKKAELLSKM